MTVDPDKRPTASEALRNPWVTGHTAADIHLSLAQAKIKEFNAKRKFRVAVNTIRSLNIMKGGSGSSDLSPDK